MQSTAIAFLSCLVPDFMWEAMGCLGWETSGEYVLALSLAAYKTLSLS